MAMYRKLGKKTKLRKALLRNQVTALIYNGKITTTEARAKEIRKIVEPMITMGDYHVAELDDGWTIVTEDGSFCSHYEHTIAINEKGLPEILSYPGYVLTEDAE